MLYDYIAIKARASPCRIWEKLPIEREKNAIAFGIFFALDVDLAVDKAHDAVSELFVDDGFNGISVDE